jgi:predicted TIM-barrel fold metal-dependent hydrolase
MRHKIIDMHTHIFPEKVASKAVRATGDYYGIPMSGEGTVDNLIADGAEIGVSRYLVCSTATKPNQVRAVNSFINDSCERHPEFFGFGTLHPDIADIEEEIARIISLKLLGVKLHSDFQEFRLDEPKAMKMYEALEGKLPVLFHMGDANTDKSKPESLRNVVKTFPKLTVIGAHFGGYSEWDSAVKSLADLHIYVDTSSSLPFLKPEHAKELIKIYGADRCLFGTDYPMWEHRGELARFDRIDLSEDERELILHKNAETLLGI